MPNIKSAKKKLRKDTKRTAKNDAYRKKVKDTIKSISKMSTRTTKVTLQKAFSTIDRAAKKKVIHKNKAARLKSRVSKLIAKK